MEAKGRAVYNSGTAFFEGTASRERFKSNRLNELILDFATDTSNRKAARRLNRIRLEEKGIGATTFRNIVEREGEAMRDHLERECEETLLGSGFDSNGALLEETVFTPNEAQYFEQAIIEQAAIKLGIWEYDASD